MLTSAVFRVVNDWGSGFTGEVKIENTEPAAISAWRLEFDFAPAINPIWNGLVVSHTGRTTWSPARPGIATFPRGAR
ncbi:MAG: cellulose binding domain-containing protein [Isosphaeraceae bacterium]